MKRFTTQCDMGGIKIFCSLMSCFFANGFGDAPTTVDIYESPTKAENSKISKREFLEHFTVKRSGSVHLAYYDCEDESIYDFSRGRWFVYRIKPLHLAIILVDEETHA